tara:strand:+ start:391 stop:1359 length:969 start_codon:yes stop_codon:yes gene_type:complete
LLIHLEKNSFNLKKKFTISRGSRNSADVLTVTIEDKGFVGLGECVPYKRYGESIESVSQDILSIPLPINNKVLQNILKPGAARNAVDCALWDLKAKKEGKPVWKILKLKKPQPTITAYTISLGNPEKMKKEATLKSNYPILKVKLGGKNDEKCIIAVREGSPNARIIVDANEGWTIESYNYLVPIFRKIGVELIEQPFPASKDYLLKGLEKKIPICADESCHDLKSIKKLIGLYDYLNIKLDKTGGLTEAIKLIMNAKKYGFKIMLGCMVGTSLAMAPALLLSGISDIVDLDGPLLLKEDRPKPLKYNDFWVFPAANGIWGI